LIVNTWELDFFPYECLSAGRVYVASIEGRDGFEAAYFEEITDP
jgi:hypothetical protein